MIRAVGPPFFVLVINPYKISSFHPFYCPQVKHYPTPLLSYCVCAIGFHWGNNLWHNCLKRFHEQNGQCVTAGTLSWVVTQLNSKTIVVVNKTFDSFQPCEATTVLSLRFFSTPLFHVLYMSFRVCFFIRNVWSINFAETCTFHRRRILQGHMRTRRSRMTSQPYGSWYGSCTFVTLLLLTY